MKTISKLALSGLFAFASTAASAAVIDGWQLDTTGAAASYSSLTTNIGHLNLSGGIGRIHQSFGADGILNAGDAFTEFGEIFSISVTKENCVGSCDAGFPVAFTSPLAGLRLAFTGLAGNVVSVDGSGNVIYDFTAGVGNIAIEATSNGTTFTTVANLTPTNPSGGSLSQFIGGIQANGTTDMLNLISSSGYLAGLFRDKNGNALDINGLKAAVHTQNTLTASNISCSTTACDLTVNSDGSFNLVPEPGSIALIGAGLLALVGFNRRRSMKS